MPSDAPEPEVDVTIGGGGLQDVSSAPRTGNVPGPRGRIITGGRTIGNRVVGGRTVGTVSVGRLNPVKVPVKNAGPKNTQFIGLPMFMATDNESLLFAHRITGRLPGESNPTGVIELANKKAGKNAGEITHLFTNPRHRRKGVATAMLDYAKLHSSSIGVTPKHSSMLSDMGEAWARSTGDFVPTRARGD